MHSRCYFSITIHGDNAVTVTYIWSPLHLSIWSPLVVLVVYQWVFMYYEYSECMQHLLYMFVPEKAWNSGYVYGTSSLCKSGGGTLAMFMALCLCERGVELWLYSWNSVFVQERWNSGYIHALLARLRQIFMNLRMNSTCHLCTLYWMAIYYHICYRSWHAAQLSLLWWS